MLSPEENRIGEYVKVISGAAYKFRHAAEYDDLYQEGMIAVWLCPPDANSSYINHSIYLRMKDWIRYVKRLRHYQSAPYEDILGYGIHETGD